MNEQNTLDALVDANERLRQENARLKADLEKSDRKCEEFKRRISGYGKIIAALDTTDCYGVLIPLADNPNSTVMQIRSAYYNMTGAGLHERLAKLEDSAKSAPRHGEVNHG